METMTPTPFPREHTDDGRFVRQKDRFRSWVSADGHTGFPAASGRYQLFVSLACPWAHRTIIVRKLKGLEAAIPMTIVDPIRDERGWRYGTHFLSELYRSSDPTYRDRVTVPVLWDMQTKRIVSNSDDDIMRMLETEFEAFAGTALDLYPHAHRAEIDELNESIFRSLNDGVYQAGFATTQHTYEEAAYRVFAMLDRLEAQLENRRYLFGSQPLETDFRLFVTLIRFDPVYYGHFKCNLRRIADYPNLSGYLRDLYQLPGIAETVDFDHIKRHYYGTHAELNPSGIVPIGPLQSLSRPHGRERLSHGEAASRAR